MYVRRVELCWHTVCFIVENIVKQKTDNMESIINTHIPEFKVQAYHNGEFKTVTDKDVLGK